MVRRPDPAAVEAYPNGFRLLPDETLAGVLDALRRGRRPHRRAGRAPLDLDASPPAAEAPWFPPGATWSARRVFVHIIAETAQHAGHADIIREAIDGQKTMG